MIVTTANPVTNGVKISVMTSTVNFANTDHYFQMTTNPSKSPDRHTFQRDNYIKRVVEEGKSLDDPNVKAMIEMYNSWALQDEEQETDTKWQENNMEFDMRSADWMVAKVRESRVYAQHLYAAMCNNEFTKNDVWPILTEKRWSCSWRYAGGIIADMQEKGDYVDWYCSGIKNNEKLDDEQFRELTKEQQEFYLKMNAYVSESVVTDEIREDLLKLGWIVIDEDSES